MLFSRELIPEFDNHFWAAVLASFLGQAGKNWTSLPEPMGLARALDSAAYHRILPLDFRASPFFDAS